MATKKFLADIQIPQGAGAGKVLTSDANGIATWATLATGSLRIVRGGVTGTTGASSGTGFTSVRNAAGDYTITFSPAFAALPTLVAMLGATGTAVSVKTFGGSVPSTSTWRLGTITGAPALVDHDFYFIAIGP